MDIDEKERPINSVKRGLVYPNKHIHCYLTLQVRQNWKVPRVVILPEKQAYADIALVYGHQCLHKWEKRAQCRDDYHGNYHKLESCPEKMLFSQFAHFGLVLGIILIGLSRRRYRWTDAKSDRFLSRLPLLLLPLYYNTLLIFDRLILIMLSLHESHSLVIGASLS